MGSAPFSKAVAKFTSLSDSHAEEAYLGLEDLERIILDHCPTSPMEAAAMLDVIIPNIACGGRADGRDVTALRRIRKMLVGELRLTVVK